MSGSSGSKGTAIVCAVIGAFVTWRGLRTLSYGLTYDRIIPAAVLTLVVGLALLAWAAWISFRRPREPQPAVQRGTITGAPSPAATAPTGPAVSDRGIDHPYLRLELPHGWRAKDAPGDLFALFERQRSELDHAMINVILGHGSPTTDGREVLRKAMDAHAASLAANHPRRMDPQPSEETVDGIVVQIMRTYLCQAGGPEWRVTARYATTTEPIGVRGLPFAKPLIQITGYEQAWGGGDVEALVRGATIAPMSRALGTQGPASGPRYPYVLHGASARQRDEALVHVGRVAEGTDGLIALGNELFLTVAIEAPDTVQPQFPSDIRADGGTLDAWLREATDRISRELGTDEIPLHVVDISGTRLIVVGPTWKAAAAVASGAIYDRAVKMLGTDRLCALVPHRDRAFVISEAPPAALNMVVTALLKTEEADARKPLSPALFRLGPGGISPLGGAVPASGGSAAGTLRSGDGVSASGDVITVRKLELAMRFPLEMPDRGTKTEASAACPDCRAAMKPVLITTGGDFGDRAVWEARPVAVDGWRCPQCEAMTYPRVLGPERITALVQEGVAHAQAGRLDDAEIALRRAASSWPGYPPPRMNLGAVYLDRIRAERAGANRPDVVERYIKEAERQLRIALSNEERPTFQLLFMLGRLLATTGRRSEGAPLLARVLADPQTPPGLRSEAQRLLQ